MCTQQFGLQEGAAARRHRLDPTRPSPGRPQPWRGELLQLLGEQRIVGRDGPPDFLRPKIPAPRRYRPSQPRWRSRPAAVRNFADPQVPAPLGVGGRRRWVVAACAPSASPRRCASAPASAVARDIWAAFRSTLGLIFSRTRPLIARCASACCSAAEVWSQWASIWVCVGRRSRRLRSARSGLRRPRVQPALWGAPLLCGAQDLQVLEAARSLALHRHLRAPGHRPRLCAFQF